MMVLQKTSQRATTRLYGLIAVQQFDKHVDSSLVIKSEGAREGCPQSILRGLSKVRCFGTSKCIVRCYHDLRVPPLKGLIDRARKR